jgi:hypothetical protein
MRKMTIWIAVLGLSFAGTCRRPAFVESETARPDPSRLRQTEATIRADLEELIRAQDAYWSENDRYALDMARLAFTPSPGVLIDILDAGRDGFSALGTVDTGDAECAVFVGSVDPPRSYAQTAGVVACRP